MSVINTNVLSLVTQNNLLKSQHSLSTSIERLSSGLRINSAKDDAAGQAIANRFSANIKGLTQASRNANDGISMAQTAEGALTEINNNLQRIRELAVQAANGTNTTADQKSIQAEIKSRLSEIDRSSATTEFNGTQLLNTTGSVAIQVGSNGGTNNQISVALTDASTTALAVSTIDVASSTSASANATAAATALSTIDAAIAKVDSARSGLGATQNQLSSAVTNIGTTVVNLTASRSRIEDADYATEVSNMTRAQILQQAGTSVLAKANQSTQGVMALLQ